MSDEDKFVKVSDVVGWFDKIANSHKYSTFFLRRINNKTKCDQCQSITSQIFFFKKYYFRT